MSEAVAWPLGLALVGAIVGSFLATLVIRWPQERSVMRGRSVCDGCRRQLTASELVPLVSSLVLRGRCRACGAAIDPRHWQVELGCAVIGALAGSAVAEPAALAGAAFGWLLLTLAALDAAELWLPDPLVLALALVGLASGLVGVPPVLVDRLIGGAAGFVVLWLVGFGYRRLRGREGLGGGDPKLFGAIGVMLGWQLLPAVLLLASATGLALLLLGLARGRDVARDDALPFGSFLAMAAYPAWLLMIAWRT